MQDVQQIIVVDKDPSDWNPMIEHLCIEKPRSCDPSYSELAIYDLLINGLSDV